MITAPNGATLKAKVVGKKKVQVYTSQVRYGGSTKVRNPGIGFGHRSYAFSKAIDIACDGDITVVITLQPIGKAHPKIELQNVTY